MANLVRAHPRMTLQTRPRKFVQMAKRTKTASSIDSDRNVFTTPKNSAKGSSCTISGVEVDTDARRTKAPLADAAVLCKAGLMWVMVNPESTNRSYYN